jgi:hypothetical protein
MGKAEKEISQNNNDGYRIKYMGEKSQSKISLARIPPICRIKPGRGLDKGGVTKWVNRNCNKSAGIVCWPFYVKTP